MTFNEYKKLIADGATIAVIFENGKVLLSNPKFAIDALDDDSTPMIGNFVKLVNEYSEHGWLTIYPFKVIKIEVFGK